MRLNLGPGGQPVIGVSHGQDAGRLSGVATSSAPRSPYRRTRSPPVAGCFTGRHSGASGSVGQDAGRQVDRASLPPPVGLLRFTDMPMKVCVLVLASGMRGGHNWGTEMPSVVRTARVSWCVRSRWCGT